MRPMQAPLYQAYPVNSIVELTLAPNREVVSGLVYCTDEISNTVVLKKSQVHTTLTSEIRIVHVASILEKKIVMDQAPASNASTGDSTETAVELAMPLPNVSKKVVEDRERRALKLAEESLRHINQKVRARRKKCCDVPIYCGVALGDSLQMFSIRTVCTS